MKNYKICEYVNPKGDTYYIVSRRLFWVFWVKLVTYEERGIDYVTITKIFHSYEDALSSINELENRNYKRVKCELV
jgi:hypothetical protein